MIHASTYSSPKKTNVCCHGFSRPPPSECPPIFFCDPERERTNPQTNCKSGGRLFFVGLRHYARLRNTVQAIVLVGGTPFQTLLVGRFSFFVFRNYRVAPIPSESVLVAAKAGADFYRCTTRLLKPLDPAPKQIVDRLILRIFVIHNGHEAEGFPIAIFIHLALVTPHCLLLFADIHLASNARILALRAWNDFRPKIDCH